jgi:NAD-dependent SIR2 family protein deacetylase
MTMASVMLREVPDPIVSFAGASLAREAKSVHDHRTSRRCDDRACNGVLHDSMSVPPSPPLLSLPPVPDPLTPNPPITPNSPPNSINFGENLPERDLEMGFDGAARADLCLALGSSLTVTPAASIPEQVARRGRRLVIVNLQPTPLDGIAAMRINGLMDDVMRRLAEKLEVDIPPFLLRRHLRASYQKK